MILVWSRSKLELISSLGAVDERFPVLGCSISLVGSRFQEVRSCVPLAAVRRQLVRRYHTFFLC